MVSVSGRRMVVVSGVEVRSCLLGLGLGVWLCRASRLGSTDLQVDFARCTARASTARCGGVARWASRWACGGLESVGSGDGGACWFAERRA